MSYDKQTWTSGEVITATKLNHMEDGIADAGGGGLVIETTFDQTDPQHPVFKSNVVYDDVVTAFTSGTTVIVHIPPVGEEADKYIQIFGYTEDYYGGGPYFDYSHNIESTITGFEEDANGYFCAPIYID